MTWITALGIDIGTSAVKVVGLTEAGEIAGFAREVMPASEASVGQQVHPADWWTCLQSALRQLAAQYSLQAVRALGVTTLCPSLLLFGADDAPLTEALLYADEGSREIAREFAANRPAAVANIVANRLAPGIASLVSVVKLARTSPQLFAQAQHLGHATTWAVQRLTGEWSIDPTHAAYTGLAAIRPQAQWLVDWTAECGIAPALLPPIFPSGAVVGQLKPAIAQSLGLSHQVQVIAGAADTACAAFYCGLREAGQKLMYSLGTTHVVTRVVEAAQLDPVFMNRNHVVLARHISHAALSSAGAALAWMNRRLLGPDQSDTARFTALAAKSPPGANGLFFWPALALERGPWWSGQPSGALLGLSQTHTEADMARATLEGLAITARLMAERMEAHYGPVKGELLCVAGGADSPLVQQITADIFGQPVFVLQHIHASAAGIATLASIAAGNLTLAGAWSTQNLQWRVVEPSPHMERYAAHLDKARKFTQLIEEEQL